MYKPKQLPTPLICVPQAVQQVVVNVLLDQTDVPALATQAYVQLVLSAVKPLVFLTYLERLTTKLVDLTVGNMFLKDRLLEEVLE